MGAEEEEEEEEGATQFSCDSDCLAAIHEQLGRFS